MRVFRENLEYSKAKRKIKYSYSPTPKMQLGNLCSITVQILSLKNGSIL